jgi:uncharacterized protein
MNSYRPSLMVMTSRSGVRLEADVYYPSLHQPGQTFPVLLMRQPYGRAIASTVVYAHPSWYAAQGYIVVIQDVRGRGTSEGKFALFESEIEDGADAVVWAANLPHSNGLVGMYGFSYQGMTQLYAAAANPAPLKAICPAMLAYDLREDWAYEGGVFCLQGNLGWAIQLAAETARRELHVSTFQALKSAASSLPLQGEIPAYPDVIKTAAPDSFYHDWINRSPEDDYWKRLSPSHWIEEISHLPMLHIGGWFDPYLRGTLRLYEAMREHSKLPQSLIIGPWAHLPWGRRSGAVDFGLEAVSDCDRAQVRWFDYWLKGEGALNQSATWFEMGTNHWVTEQVWPSEASEARRSQWHLKITGLASMRGSALAPQSSILREGEIPKPPELGVGGLFSEEPLSDVIVHDPWRPVPAVGGHAGFPAGPIDRSAVDDRSDVLTYSTEPLTEPILIQGNPWVDLCFSSDAKSIDIHVVLSQMTTLGKVLPIAQGVCQVCPQERTTAKVVMQATSLVVPIGSTLRVSVSLSCFPAFPINPGTGIQVAKARAIEAQVVTLFLQSGILNLSDFT